jgi:hypothetical protein
MNTTASLNWSEPRHGIRTAPEPTAIKSVSYYVACSVETCDRCGQGIKYVHPVSLKDGTVFKYGSECINAVLEGDNSLKSLWRKNANQLKRLKLHLKILNRPLDQIPTEREYYNSGIYIITDGSGKTINGSRTGCILFHPTVNVERNADSQYAIKGQQRDWVEGGRRVYGNYTHEVASRLSLEAIENAKVYIKSEIERIELFLARILAKGLIKQ